MINQETLTAIYPLVEKLSKAGYMVIPVEESPLYALNQAAYSPVIDSWEGETGFIEAWLASLERTPVLGMVGINETTTDANSTVTVNLSMYSRSLDECADLLAMSVRNAMSHARNVARPTVSSIIDSMNEFVVNSSVVKEPYEIVDVSLTKVWDNPVVLGTMDSFKPRLQRLARKDIPKVPVPEDLSDHMTTGAVAFDQAFTNAIRETGVTVEDAFNTLFNSSADLTAEAYPFYRTRNLSMVCYLMASILLKKPIKGSGLDGLQWETLLHRMTNTLGDGCKFIYETYQSDQSADILHFDTDEVDGKVYLNGPVYERWLNSGGSPEIIFGALLNQRDNPSKPILFSETLENKDQYLRFWTNHHATVRSLEDAKRLDMVKNGLYSSLVLAIDDAERAYLPDLAPKETLYTRAKELVSKVTTHDISDIGKLCQSLTCDVMFYHTPSKYLLNRINDRCNEGLAPDEAATAVMIEYITDWMALGLHVKKQG